MTVVDCAPILPTAVRYNAAVAHRWPPKPRLSRLGRGLVFSSVVVTLLMFLLGVISWWRTDAIIVPKADSPVKGDNVITIDEMKQWLASKGLRSS